MKSSIIAAIVLTLGVATQGFAQDQGNNLVIPVNANTFGASYAEWSARWWEWAYSIPAANNPILDTTGANCNQNQSGRVFFLAGTAGGPAVTRTCTVPVGKALFFPIVNDLFGSGVGDCTPTNEKVPCNLADLRSLAAEAVDPSVVQLRLTIDQDNIDNLVGQRVQSPIVTITFPANNIQGVAAGTYSPQVGDGYYVMVPPLSAGTHRIHFKAVFTGGPFSGFTVEVTYVLTV